MKRHPAKGYKQFRDDDFAADPLTGHYNGHDHRQQQEQEIHRRTKSAYYHDDGFHPEQFRERIHTRTPWKAIGLATFLFIGGTIALVTCILGLAGHIKLPDEAPTALLAIGLLMFVPGFYHVRIAIYAYKEYPGYSFDDLRLSSDF